MDCFRPLAVLLVWGQWICSCYDFTAKNSMYNLRWGHIFPLRHMMDGELNVNLPQDESAKSSQSSQASANSSAFANLSCVWLSLINGFPCCTTSTTHQDPGRDTDNSAAYINNWLQRVTEKNRTKWDKRRKKKQTEVQDMDITPGCDVQTELICSRK